MQKISKKKGICEKEKKELKEKEGIEDKRAKTPKVHMKKFVFGKEKK